MMMDWKRTEPAETWEGKKTEMMRESDLKWWWWYYYCDTGSLFLCRWVREQWHGSWRLSTRFPSNSRDYKWSPKEWLCEYTFTLHLPFIFMSFGHKDNDDKIKATREHEKQEPRVTQPVSCCLQLTQDRENKLWTLPLLFNLLASQDDLRDFHSFLMPSWCSILSCLPLKRWWWRYSRQRREQDDDKTIKEKAVRFCPEIKAQSASLFYFLSDHHHRHHHVSWKSKQSQEEQDGREERIFFGYFLWLFLFSIQFSLFRSHAFAFMSPLDFPFHDPRLYRRYKTL